MAAGLRIRADGILVAGQARLRTDALPVDDHEGAILESVARHRVTIIQGGTGSGKSSRVPYMLMRAASRGKNGPKLMVAQPRRVAARALYQRALAEAHLRGSAAVGDTVGADLESLCRGWVQPSSFR